jgi:hypothetical protein
MQVHLVVVEYERTPAIVFELVDLFEDVIEMTGTDLTGTRPARAESACEWAPTRGYE